MSATVTATSANWNASLIEAMDGRLRLIVTDGVFSMDGSLAKLPEICDLAGRHDAIVVVDDSPATGILGATGRGTPEHFDVLNRVDLHLKHVGQDAWRRRGVALRCGQADVIEFLRQALPAIRLFSNALPPPIVMAAKKRLELVGDSDDLRNRSACQCPADAYRSREGWLPHQARRTSDSAGDAGRRGPGESFRRPAR